MKFLQLLWPFRAGRSFDSLVLGLALFGASFIGDAGGASGAQNDPPPGGGAPPAENPDNADGGAPDESGELDAAGDGDDRDGDDDPDAEEVEAEERLLSELEAANDPKKWRNQIRHLRRKLQKSRSISDRFRDPVSGHYTDVDHVLTRSRDYDELNRVIASNPRLAAQFLAAREGRPVDDADQDTGARADAFPDDDALPFDTNTEHGRFIRDELKRGRQLAGEVKQLRGIVQQMLSGLQTDRTATVRDTWHKATVEASQSIDPKFQKAFVNSVGNRFAVLRATNSLSRANMRQIIGQELGLFKAAGRGAKGAGTAAAVAAARMATTNNQRPGAVRAQGAPAGDPTKGKADTGTIRDSKKSFFGRIAGR